MSGYYPAELTDWSPNAPWNDPGDPPEKDFEITVSQTLSKGTTVTTTNYIPGAEGVDYEPDDEGGYCASGWHEPDDTSDTDWEKEYDENGHYTPIQLIELLKEYLQKDLEKWKEEDKKDPHKWAAIQVRKYQGLIEECDGWTEDETEFVED